MCLCITYEPYLLGRPRSHYSFFVRVFFFVRNFYKVVKICHSNVWCCKSAVVSAVLSANKSYIFCNLCNLEKVALCQGIYSGCIPDQRKCYHEMLQERKRWVSQSTLMSTTTTQKGLFSSLGHNLATPIIIHCYNVGRMTSVVVHYMSTQVWTYLLEIPPITLTHAALCFPGA